MREIEKIYITEYTQQRKLFSTLEIANFEIMHTRSNWEKDNIFRSYIGPLNKWLLYHKKKDVATLQKASKTNKELVPP